MVFLRLHLSNTEHLTALVQVLFGDVRGDLEPGIWKLLSGPKDANRGRKVWAECILALLLLQPLTMQIKNKTKQKTVGDNPPQSVIVPDLDGRRSGWEKCWALPPPLSVRTLWVELLKGRKPRLQSLKTLY